MAALIDNEAEPPALVVLGRNEETALLRARASSAAACRDDFDEALRVAGCDCRHHDPIVGVIISIPLRVTSGRDFARAPTSSTPASSVPFAFFGSGMR